jgi:hypothetical protein
VATAKNYALTADSTHQTAKVELLAIVSLAAPQRHSHQLLTALLAVTTRGPNLTQTRAPGAPIDTAHAKFVLCTAYAPCVRIARLVVRWWMEPTLHA